MCDPSTISFWNICHTESSFEIILDISLPGLQQHDGGVSQVGKPLLLGRVGLVAVLLLLLLPEHLAAAAGPLLEPRQSRAESEDE